jgi:hypothetical protein
MRNILIAFALTSAVSIAAELPVRTVVLYKHGVGYFERSGPLGPGESARLDFRAEEMNDVLKSLIVNDQGGRVSGLRYDSSIPLSEKLNEFPFHINNGEPLSAVLDQLKGARVELDFGQQKTAGGIVSARVIPASQTRQEFEQLTLLTDLGELRNVDLSAASAIRFADPKLQLQFKDYLTALTSSRSKDKKSVYIDSTDSKSRDVTASYIMPMPAWKSSYRLIFAPQGEPTLEGWAIVDNTTGEDWTNVKVSLVSGKPISFISQLYDPKYIRRLTADLPEDQAVGPTVHSGAVDFVNPMAKAPAPAPAMRNMAGAAQGESRGGVGGGVGAGNLSAAAPSSVTEAGSAREIADLFIYDIKNPVTVRKSESAMLPFLQQKITARKLILYSDASRPNPLNAAELTNSAGRTLDGGPITVYDAGSYAGEALVETVKSGDKRFISYGVDLGTRISTNSDSRNDDVREIHVRNGVLTARAARVQKKTYSIRNVDAKEKTLILEHPVRAAFHLINTAKPLETARDVYRFEIKLAPNASVDFPVTEENVYDNQLTISSLTPDSLGVYLRNVTLADAARRQLQQVADLKTAIAKADTDRRAIEADVHNIETDEQRNRQNIASLSSVSGQQQIVQDYAHKLADQETQISGFRARQTQVDQQKAKLQNDLDTLIGRLDF